MKPWPPENSAEEVTAFSEQVMQNLPHNGEVATRRATLLQKISQLAEKYERHPVFWGHVEWDAASHVDILEEGEKACSVDPCGRFFIDPETNGNRPDTRRMGMTREANPQRVSDDVIKALQKVCPLFFHLDGTPRTPMIPFVFPDIKRIHENPAEEYRRLLRRAVESILQDERFAPITFSTRSKPLETIDSLPLEETSAVHRTLDTAPGTIGVVLPFVFQNLPMPTVERHAVKLPSYLRPIDPLLGMTMILQNPQALQRHTPDFVFLGERERTDDFRYLYITAAGPETGERLGWIEEDDRSENGHDATSGVIFLHEN